MSKYVILNKYGRVHAVANELYDIVKALRIPQEVVLTKFEQGKPIQGRWLVMLREKHEYLWHKYGGRHGGDDHFAFCTPEELRAYKETEKRSYLDICDKYKPMRL